VFAGKTAPEMTAKAWVDAVYGTWPTDVTDAKIKDPTIDIGIFGQVTSVLAWKKLLSKAWGARIGRPMPDRGIQGRGGQRRRQAVFLAGGRHRVPGRHRPRAPVRRACQADGRKADKSRPKK
jgi:hypothetical protein